jgi:hypothetical protein
MCAGEDERNAEATAPREVFGLEYALPPASINHRDLLLQCVHYSCFKAAVPQWSWMRLENMRCVLRQLERHAMLRAGSCWPSAHL